MKGRLEEGRKVTIYELSKTWTADRLVVFLPFLSGKNTHLVGLEAPVTLTKLYT